jgi:hypothetical protein
VAKASHSFFSIIGHQDSNLPVACRTCVITEDTSQRQQSEGDLREAGTSTREPQELLSTF